MRPIIRLLFVTLFVGVAGIAVAQGSLFNQSGTLAEGDARSDDGALYDEYTFELKEGDRVVFEMTSDDFDAYLVLRAPDGQIVQTNDDGDYEETNTNSRLTYRVEASGTYTLLATSLFPDSRGKYTVTRVR